YEIMNNSLTKTSYYENNEAYPLSRCVSVMNPLSQDLGVMRQSLLYGGLESIARNVNRKHADLKLYEFGNCYHYDSAAEQEGQPLAAYSEEMHLAFWLTGNKAAQSWIQAETKSTFFELKAYVFNVMRRLGVDTDRLSLLPLTEVQGTLFGEGVILMLGQQEFGYIASVNKALRRQFGIDAEVFYADLLWSRLMQQNKRYKMEYREMSNFPEVRRDFALLLDKSVKFADLRQLAMQTERKLLKRVNLFDVYEGKNLPAGKKSYALSFFLQDENKTLEDRQIDNIMSRLQKAFEEKFGATLR
ncbi:MAG: phenylalanine--tRNA ligase subunit beta, partial [Paludibacteraceae bacterium]|nr:phenylalanine--tRNA ligase subunit beta [Paludibacteraceae bacterium]